jgi:hypothetical protein
MKATIYIPEDKAAFYEKAKEELGGTISATFVRCIERELEARRLETAKIVVELYDCERDRTTKKAFEGRWLIGDESEGEPHLFDEEKTGIRGGGHYSVALTAKGRIAVLEQDPHQTSSSSFDVFQDFGELKAAELDGRYPKYPDSLVSAVADALGVDHVEHLDI